MLVLVWDSWKYFLLQGACTEVLEWSGKSNISIRWCENLLKLHKVYQDTIGHKCTSLRRMYWYRRLSTRTCKLRTTPPIPAVCVLFFLSCSEACDKESCSNTKISVEKLPSHSLIHYWALVSADSEVDLVASFWRTWRLTSRRSWTWPTRWPPCSPAPPLTTASPLSSRGNRSRSDFSDATFSPSFKTFTFTATQQKLH